jgi:putative ABC transport system permease protein
MKLIRLLTLRTLRTRPLRFLLSTFGIILGVTAILSMGITNQAAMGAITRLFDDTSGRAKLVVVSAGGEADKIDERVLKVIGRQAGVATAVPSIQITTFLAGEAPPGELTLSFFGADTGGLVLYGIDPLLDQATREYTIVDGSFLTGDPGGEEIVLVDSYAETQKLALGDWVEIVTVYGPQRMRLVGLMDKQGPGRLNNGAFGVVPLEFAQKSFNRLYELDQIDVLVSPEYDSNTAVAALQANLQNELGRTYSVIYPAAQGQRMLQMVSNYRIGLDFLGGIALFVGAFLIYNAFSMSVVERTREIGMLRTIGLTHRQVARQIIVEAGLMGLVGALLGIAAGILLARGLTRLMALLLDQDLSALALPLDLTLQSGAIGLLVALVAALIPAWQAARISPLEALRSRGNRQEGWLLRHGWQVGGGLLLMASLLLLWNPYPHDERFRVGSVAVMALFLGGTLILPAIIGFWDKFTGPLIKQFYGSSGMLGSRNIQRAKVRTTLTVAALMIGVAMMIVVWIMTESFKGDVEEWLAGYMGGDLYVTSSVNLRDSVWRRLEAVEGVAAVTPLRYFEVKMATPDGGADTILFSAVDPTSYAQVTAYTFDELAGQAEAAAMARLDGGDTIFISSVIAELYDLQVGDSVQLMAKTGMEPFTIAAVVVDFYNQGLVVHGSWRDMGRHFRVRDANALMVKVTGDAAVHDVIDRIEMLFGDRYHLVIEANQSMKARASQLMRAAFSMFDVLALIAMIVAFLGISNTLTMNVLERTQEIGMLRSIGMTQRQVLGMILAEAGALGLLGGVLGILFGLFLARLFLASMATMSGYSVTFVLPFMRVAAGLVVALLVSHLAAILPARRATRVHILDAIRFE